MSPTLKDGDYVFALKENNYKQGDIIAISLDNQIIIKRIIGVEGDEINIDYHGNVYVNGNQLNELYTSNISLNPSNIRYPYIVKDNSVFVLGDNRLESIDSRNKQISSIDLSLVKGKIFFCVWPFNNFKIIK